MQSKEFYNKTADQYNLRQSNPSTARLRKEEEFLIKKYAKGKILDIGCATGYHLKFIEKEDIGDAFGIDVAHKMLVQSAKITSAKLVNARAEALPFGDSNFDTILCLFTTLNLFDYEKAIAEMKRVLKPGGCIILSVASVWDLDWTPLSDRLKDVTSKKKIVRIHGEKLDFILFSKSDLIRIFEEAGFNLIDFRGLFLLQRPYWGRFEDFKPEEKRLLEEEQNLEHQKNSQAAAMYLAVFEKKF